MKHLRKYIYNTYEIYLNKIFTILYYFLFQNLEINPSTSSMDLFIFFI